MTGVTPAHPWAWLALSGLVLAVTAAAVAAVALSRSEEAPADELPEVSELP